MLRRQILATAESKYMYFHTECLLISISQGFILMKSGRFIVAG